MVLKKSPSPEIVEDLETPVALFLAGLNLNLSVLHNALKHQGLGTSETLFAIAGWPEEILHQMLKEALPQITPAQWFMLVIGLQEYEHRRGVGTRY
jgi:hypothetical protein